MASTIDLLNQELRQIIETGINGGKDVRISLKHPQDAGGASPIHEFVFKNGQFSLTSWIPSTAVGAVAMNIHDSGGVDYIVPLDNVAGVRIA